MVTSSYIVSFQVHMCYRIHWDKKKCLILNVFALCWWVKCIFLCTLSCIIYQHMIIICTHLHKALCTYAVVLSHIICFSTWACQILSENDGKDFIRWTSCVCLRKCELYFIPLLFFPQYEKNKSPTRQLQSVIIYIL